MRDENVLRNLSIIPSLLNFQEKADWLLALNPAADSFMSHRGDGL
jgi:hypothetical protein